MLVEADQPVERHCPSLASLLYSFLVERAIESNQPKSKQVPICNSNIPLAIQLSGLPLLAGVGGQRQRGELYCTVVSGFEWAEGHKVP